MKIGYARISTQDQNLDLQNDALAKAGCEKIFTDTASGSKNNRSGLADAIMCCRKDDTLVVWKLDRLGRSLRHLIVTVNDLNEQGIEVQSLCENIDTSTPGGKLIFHVFGALAEFERELIRERTNAGIISARARGKMGGRPPKTTLPDIRMIQQLATDPNNRIKAICKKFRISRTSYYRYLKSPIEEG